MAKKSPVKNQNIAVIGAGNWGIKKGATLGANATIVCGHTIGSYAFVAAGAVITRDVPAHALMVRNPARQTGWICQCGYKLNAKHQCPQCGNRYKMKAKQGLQKINNS